MLDIVLVLESVLGLLLVVADDEVDETVVEVVLDVVSVLAVVLV